MIRILHVVTYMGRGGLETMLMNYYRHIDRTEFQFDFLTHRDFRADYDDEIESLGGKIFHLPRLVPWSKNYINALDRIFSEHPEYKIVHVHQDCLSSVILKSAKKHGVPVRIAHSHNSSQDRNLKYPIKLFYRSRIPRYATDLFACGKQAGDWMFRGASYTVVNNAIDAKSYCFSPEKADAVRNELGISATALVVGHVGRFSPAKNHAFLLDVFRRINQKHSDSVLLLVGDGELRAEAEERARQLRIEKNVIFTGVRSDVSDLMAAMNVFVFPSLYEGFPVTLLEAQASGLPCIVSDRISGECSVTPLVKPESLSSSPDKWADKVLEAAKIERCCRSEEISAAGFDISENVLQLQEFYFSKLKERV